MAFKQERASYVRALVLLVAASAGLMGCAQDRGYVQRQWAGTFRELGIVPVFPPREDVYVGDVYASVYDPEDMRIQNLLDKKYSAMTADERALRMQIGISPPLARLDLTCEAFNTYKDTPSWPATTSDDNSLIGGSTPESLAGPIARQKQIVEERTAEIATIERDFVKARAERATAAGETGGLTGDSSGKRATSDQDEQILQSLKAQRADLVADLEKAQTPDQRTTALEQIGKKDKEIDTAQARWDKSKAATAQAEKALADNKKAIDALDKRLNELADKKAAAEKASDLAQKHIEELNAFAAAAGANSAFRREPRDPTYDVFRNSELPDPPEAPQGDLDFIDEMGAKDGSEGGEAGRIPTPAQRRAARDAALLARADDLQNSRVNRLKLVGFPDFAATTFNQGELSALVPIEGFALGVRGNFANLKSVSVKVPAAESYSVPLDLVQKRVIERVCADCPQGRLVRQLIDGCQFQFPAPTDFGKASEDERYFYLRVITEVYYARALDISLITKGSFGARAELETLASAATRQASDPIDMQNPQSAAALDKDPRTLTSADMVAMTEKKLGQRLKVPGGFVQLVSYTDTTIGLRRVYERPIAIGFRGITLKVERGTGRVSGVRVSNLTTNAVRSALR